MRSGAYIEKKRLTAEFKLIYIDNDGKKSFLQNEFFELKSKYLTISDPGCAQSDLTFSAKTIRCLKRINSLDFQVSFPFLLKLLEKNISQDDLQETINLLESYFVRRAIVGEDVKPLRKIFMDLCYSYEIRPENSPINIWVKNLFVEDRKKGKLSIMKYPTDEEVNEHLCRDDIYNKNENITNYILLRLNEFLMGKEYPGEIAGYQIEHVLPQTDTVEWKAHFGLDDIEFKRVHSECVGLIGNLTLTKLNPEMRQKLFRDKKEYLKISAYRLTSELGNRSSDIWTQHEIKDRTRELTGLILKMFPDIK